MPPNESLKYYDRNRDEHLRYFLEYMHKILQRQELEYQIFVINQVGNDPFNRAKLLNVGFIEALKLYDWDCFVFHDVDLGKIYLTLT